MLKGPPPFKVVTYPPYMQPLETILEERAKKQKEVELIVLDSEEEELSMKATLERNQT